MKRKSVRKAKAKSYRKLTQRAIDERRFDGSIRYFSRPMAVFSVSTCVSVEAKSEQEAIQKFIEGICLINSDLHTHCIENAEAELE